MIVFIDISAYMHMKARLNAYIHYDYIRAHKKTQ